MLTHEIQPRQSSPFPDRRQASRRYMDLELLQRERELDAARRICQSLFQHINVDELVVKVLRTALEVVGAEAGSVLLADFTNKELVFRYVIGEKADRLQGTAISWDHGIAGTVFRSGEPEVIADVKQDRRHLPSIDILSGYKTRDMITMPLKRWEGEPIGVLEVLNKREGQLGAGDVAILTIISAISAMEIEQARLHEAAKLAEVVRLLGDIGHDVKNLLQPVVAGAQLLLTELEEFFESSPPDPAKAQATRHLSNEVLAMLLEDARRIHDRVREISDCVKGLSAPPQFAPCRVEDVVENVLKSLRVLADEKGIAIRMEGLAALPIILADGRRLYNAFYNLVNNAIPEVPPGGSITIGGSTDEAAGMVVLSVADSGRGMPPEIRNSLFTARAISRNPGGTGLGTKIVKDVVDAHGGQITVESKEGVGTTFVMRVPVQPPGSARSKELPENP